MMTTDLRPDARAALAALEAADFLEGVSRGWWQKVEVDWPYIVVVIKAAQRNNDGGAEIALRLETNGYPADGPTCRPWDRETEDTLAAAKRPRGEYVGWMFRVDWEQGQALYAPFDRRAIAGHPSWPAHHPADIWNNTRTLGWLLGRIHQALNDDDYEGCG